MRSWAAWFLAAAVVVGPIGRAVGADEAAPAPPEAKYTLKLWPGKAPGEVGTIGAEQFQADRPNDAKKVKRLMNVTEPLVEVFPAPGEKADAPAVVICPGGGYSILAWDLEGTEVAQWLNTQGVTGVVLKYRVPKREKLAKHELPLMDAQRAVRLVRAHAKDWGIDPKNVGILGFSAGGHLAAAASTNYEKSAYEAIDDADKLSARPDFSILIYPAYLVEKGALAPEFKVTKDTPPAFLAHTHDDGVTAESSARYYLALLENKIPAELHIYRQGGHGYGLRPSANSVSTWPARCNEWLKAQKIVK